MSERECLHFFLLFFFHDSRVRGLRSWTAFSLTTQCTAAVIYTIYIIYVHSPRPANDVLLAFLLINKLSSRFSMLATSSLRHPPWTLRFFFVSVAQPALRRISYYLLLCLKNIHPADATLAECRPNADPMGKATLGGPANRLDSRRLYMRAHAPTAKLPPRVT